MARVSFDDPNLGKRDKPHAFQYGQTRFCMVEGCGGEKALYHYSEELKKAIECSKHGDLKDPQGRCYYCDVEPLELKERYATNILIYYADQRAQPLGPFGQQSFRFDWWAFAWDKLGEIQTIQGQFGDLRVHDLIFTCTDVKYQKGTFQPCPDAWWQQNPQIVVERFQQDRKTDLLKRMCTQLPDFDKQQALVMQRRNRAPQQQPGQQGQGYGGQGPQGYGGQQFGGQQQPSGWAPGQVNPQGAPFAQQAAAPTGFAGFVQPQAAPPPMAGGFGTVGPTTQPVGFSQPPPVAANPMAAAFTQPAAPAAPLFAVPGQAPDPAAFGQLPGAAPQQPAFQSPFGAPPQAAPVQQPMFAGQPQQGFPPQAAQAAPAAPAAPIAMPANGTSSLDDLIRAVQQAPTP